MSLSHLSSHEALLKETKCFISLLSQVGLIGEEMSKVNHILVKEHASDSSGELLLVDLLNYWINSVSNKLLSFVGVCNLFKSLYVK